MIRYLFLPLLSLDYHDLYVHLTRNSINQIEFRMKKKLDFR